MKFYKNIRPCDKFGVVYYFYMNPFNLIHINKYNRDAIEYLMIRLFMFIKNQLNPGEMVGMIGVKVLENQQHK